jgi:hypothetical protein
MIFRRGSAVSRRRQAPFRLFARSPAGLRAIVIALVVTPEGLLLACGYCQAIPPTRPRCAGFSNASSGNTARPAASGDGPRCADAGGLCRDAVGRPAGLLPGGYAEGRPTRLQKHLVDKPWQEVRPGVLVKLLSQDGELYVLLRGWIPKGVRSVGVIWSGYGRGSNKSRP